MHSFINFLKYSWSVIIKTCVQACSPWGSEEPPFWIKGPQCQQKMSTAIAKKSTISVQSPDHLMIFWGTRVCSGNGDHATLARYSNKTVKNSNRTVMHYCILKSKYWNQLKYIIRTSKELKITWGKAPRLLQMTSVYL